MRVKRIAGTYFLPKNSAPHEGQLRPDPPFVSDTCKKVVVALHAEHTHSSFVQSLNRSPSSIRDLAVKPQSSSPKRSSPLPAILVNLIFKKLCHCHYCCYCDVSCGWYFHYYRHIISTVIVIGTFSYLIIHIDIFDINDIIIHIIWLSSLSLSLSSLLPLLLL